MQRSARPSRTALVSALLLALSASAWSQASSFAAPQAQVLRATQGQALGQAAGGSHASAVAASMRGRGLGDATARSLVEIGGGPGQAGLTHVRMEQQVGGLTVYGTSVKSTFNAKGDLIHLIEKIVPVTDAAPKGAAINERQALDAAMTRVHPDVRASFAAGTKVGKSVRFAGGAFFHEAPEVTRVLVPQTDGSLAQGFLVQTWTQRGNLLDHTLVGGDGAVLSVERRTANDSYNVFAVSPGVGPQTIVNGPASGATQPSPNGWLLAGTQNTIKINGNNVSAYLDAAANNKADTGGSSVSNGAFTTAANLTQSPSTAANRNVAVQNLFYLNNRIHDILYGHGFNESAGNFQINNFGNGGAGNDPVNAEAQDGGGTDNANFSTPTDGSRPRMQMYLWTGAGNTHEVIVGGSSYGAMGAQFGPALTTSGLSGALAVPTSGTDGCTAVGGVSGKIAIVDRGTCDFVTKVANAQSGGATGVIVANNAATAIFTMGGTSRARIPSVMVSQADGATLKSLKGSTGTMRLKATQPLQLDGDLDSDIVYHEYGHGLTWRMIGGMSGPLAGAIGEGASDVTAFMVNGNDKVGVYAASSPSGIRRYPYAAYPLTYANVTGAEVHNDGEIYAAAMWRLRELWLGSRRSNDALFKVFVDGMNYTPATPAFENMRNGMLDSIKHSNPADAAAQCALVWQAFAQYGIGDTAKGVVTSSTSVSITPSNTARADCTHN
jgi:hypothetical protein